MKNVGIAINKSLLKVYDDENVYLKDGQEFQLMIFNPHQFKVGVRISLNGELIPNALILRPGERVWVDRYLHCDKKFKFTTYNVDNNDTSKTAIAKNGKVQFDFYRTNQSQGNYIINDSWNWFNDCSGGKTRGIDIQPNITWQSSTSQNCAFNTSEQVFSSISASSARCNSITTADYNSKVTSNEVKKDTIETGLIEKGSTSSQKLQYVDDCLDLKPFDTYVMYIKPYSTKPIYKNDIQKRYCYNCGKRLNQKYKYCPQCGTKIE